MDQVVKVVDLPQDGDIRALMEEQLAACQPLVIRGALANWPALRSWQPANDGFKRMEALAGSAEVQVMVAPVGKAFYGDVRSKRMVGASFSEFLHMAQAASGSLEGNTSNAQEQLYLAQSPMLDAEQTCAQPLAPLLADVQMPAFLDRVKVTNVNLWVSVNGSKSSTHYDPYQNLLCVVAGTKKVSLWDPTATAGLYPMALHGEAFNHSAVNFAAPDLSRYPRYKEVLGKQQTVEVRAGDALFIPEGWWHQVDSKGTTIAVNIWWQSRFSAMLGTHMDAYYARQAIASLLFNEKKQRLASLSAPRAPPTPPSAPPPSIAGNHMSAVRDQEPPALERAASSLVTQRGESLLLVNEAKPLVKGKRKSKGRRRKALASASNGAETRREEEHENQLRVDSSVRTDSDAAEPDRPNGVAASSGRTQDRVAGVETLQENGASVAPEREQECAEGLNHSEAWSSQQSEDSQSVQSDERRDDEKVGTAKRDAAKRRLVVDCLSVEEAQLLRALVLEAGRNGVEQNGSEQTGNEQSKTGFGTTSASADGDSVGLRESSALEVRIRESERRGDVVAGIFAGTKAGQLQRLLLAMAMAFPRALERLILYSLSPVACELLTTRFEDLDREDISSAVDDPLRLDSPSHFFERFYDVFEDRNAAMEALLNGKEAFATQALQDVLRDLQGVADVSAQSGMTKEPLS